jgi:hypothetical protein
VNELGWSPTVKRFCVQKKRAYHNEGASDPEDWGGLELVAAIGAELDVGSWHCGMNLLTLLCILLRCLWCRKVTGYDLQPSISNLKMSGRP